MTDPKKIKLMKKTICSLWLAPILLISCFDDDSTLATNSVPDIIVTGFDKESYDITSYSGETLTIEGFVNTGYREEDLTYKWYYYSQAESDRAASEPVEFHFVQEARTLHYEMNLDPGDYTFILEVSAPNGYTVQKTVGVHVTTDFSQGFYILKETTEGCTDLDLYSADGRLRTDIITAVEGAPLRGKPVTVSWSRNHGYINPDDNTRGRCETLNVTTSDGEFRMYRTTDFVNTHDRSNMLYDNIMEEDETPYFFGTTSQLNICISNRGMRTQDVASFSFSGVSVGCYKQAMGNGGSTFMAYDIYEGYTTWWSESEHCFYFYGNFGEERYQQIPSTGLDNLTCLKCGYNAGTHTTFFIMEDCGSGTRYLYLISYDSGEKEMTVNRRNTLSSHLSKATVLSYNHLEATLLYCVDDNHIYAYNYETGEYTELHFDMLPTGEAVTFMQNLYDNDGSSLLAVGTQKSNDYKIYLYHTLGGQPDGAPVHTVCGKGRLCGLRYISSDSTTQGVDFWNN